MDLVQLQIEHIVNFCRVIARHCQRQQWQDHRCKLRPAFTFSLLQNTCSPPVRYAEEYYSSFTDDQVALDLRASLLAEKAKNFYKHYYQHSLLPPGAFDTGRALSFRVNINMITEQGRRSCMLFNQNFHLAADAQCMEALMQAEGPGLLVGATDFSMEVEEFAQRVQRGKYLSPELVLEHAPYLAVVLMLRGRCSQKDFSWPELWKLMKDVIALGNDSLMDIGHGVTTHFNVLEALTKKT